MNLKFRLLVVDDNPDSIAQAFDALRDYLTGMGFHLESTCMSNYSRKVWKDLSRSEGRDYDLVMVDFRLGRNSQDGALATRRLRNDLPFTDMVFYSSDPEANLRNELAKHLIDGVFVATRQDLADALIGLARTVIGKAVDLNHTRGIAMAEVAEMDVLMEETLQRALRSTGDQCLDSAVMRTKAKVLDHIQRKSAKIVRLFDEGGLSEVVGDGRLFTSAYKYQTLRRFAKCLPAPPYEALDMLKCHDNEIRRTRNTLAHAKEESNEDGKIILRYVSSSKETIIDDEWMSNLRRRLQIYRTALSTVCNALDTHFGTPQTPQDPKEGQP